MFCPKCGTAQPEGSTACVRCGAAIPPPAPRTNPLNPVIKTSPYSDQSTRLVGASPIDLSKPTSPPPPGPSPGGAPTIAAPGPGFSPSPAAGRGTPFSSAYSPPPAGPAMSPYAQPPVQPSAFNIPPSPGPYNAYPSVNVNPGYPQYGGFPSRLDNSKASGRAITGMILGLAAWVFGGPFLGIPGFIVSKMELNAIRRGESSRAGETLAKIGFYAGLANTILFVGIIALVFLIILANA